MINNVLAVCIGGKEIFTDIAPKYDSQCQTLAINNYIFS